jgi:hypothetical protein
MKLLEKTPTRRFASTDEVAEALDAVANEDDSSRNRTSLNFKPVASRKPEPVTARDVDSADSSAESGTPTEKSDQTPDIDASQVDEQPIEPTDNGPAVEVSAEVKPDETRARPSTEPLVSISSKIAVSTAPEPSEPPTKETDLNELETESTKFKETGRWFVESVDELQATNPNIAAEFDDYNIPKDRNIFPIIVLVLGLVVGGLVWSSYDSDEAENTQKAASAETADSDKKNQERRAEIAAKAAVAAKVHRPMPRRVP